MQTSIELINDQKIFLLEKYGITDEQIKYNQLTTAASILSY